MSTRKSAKGNQPSKEDMLDNALQNISAKILDKVVFGFGVDPVEIVNYLEKLLSWGASVTIGRTRDGSNLILSVFMAGKPYKYYCEDTTQMMEILEQIISIIMKDTDF